MLKTGMSATKEFTVTEEMLAVNVGSGDVRVLATPEIVVAVENTAANFVKSFLNEGDTTVGMNISVSHIAATPIGMKFTVNVELTEISPNGRILTFAVSAFDEKDKISEGTHTRVIVRKERFESKANSKGAVQE